MAPKMKGGDMTEEQKRMLANLAMKGLTYAGKKFAKSDMGNELGGLASNLASSAFSSLFGNGNRGSGFFDSSYSGAKESMDRRIEEMKEEKSKQEEKERRRKKKQEETGWKPIDFDAPIEFDSDGDYEGRDWLLGRGGASGGAKGDQRRFMSNRAVPNRVPNAVRVREMNDVKNYNRQQQQRVFDMEKRQVQGESESIKPIDAKDAGAAFKLQSYMSKLQQILGQKADLFSQLQASPFTDLNQLKGTTKQSSLLTMIASKAEFLQAYNEMVSYVFLFFKDVQLDNRVRDRMYASYFSPLIDQMRQLGQQYPALFSTIPAPVRAEQVEQPETRQGKVYELVRKELRDMYSLLNVASDNIQDGIFRTIGAKDVAEYSRDNGVNRTFAVNPPPPSAPMPSMASQQAAQQIRVADQVVAGNARAAAAQAAEIAERDPYDPRGDIGLDPQTQASYTQIQSAMRQQGRAPDTVIPVMTAAAAAEAYRTGAMSGQQIDSVMGRMFATGILMGVSSQQQLQQVIQENNEEMMAMIIDRIAPAVQLYNDWVVSRGVLAPEEQERGSRSPSPQPRGRSPPAQPGQRDQSVPPQNASPDQIDAAVEDFVRRSRFPTDRVLPTQDSGGGDFGGERWRPIAAIMARLRDNGFVARYVADIKTAIRRYNATKPKQKPGRKKPQQQQPGQQGGPARSRSPSPQQQGGPAQQPGSRSPSPAQQDPFQELGGNGMSGGRFRSHQNLRRSELDFVPAKALNSAAPPVSMGYGSHHRPKFAWEQEQEAAGPRYVRQDRQIYNRDGGLGMVNPDNEVSTYHVLRTAGEVGRGMSGGVYLPKEYVVQPAGEKEFFGYGVDGDNDVFGMEGGYGSLKRRLGMANPFAVSKDYHYKPKETGYDDAMDFAYGNHEQPNEATQQAHEEEEEKPVDLDENPNPFRVRQENYKVNTGKMKKVSYKMPNM